MGGTPASPTCQLPPVNRWGVDVIHSTDGQSKICSQEYQVGQKKLGTETRSHPPSLSSLHWRCEKPSCFCSQGIWVNHDHFYQPEVESETLFNHQDWLNWRLVRVGSKAQHLLISRPRPVGGELSFLIPGSSHHQRWVSPDPYPFHRKANALFLKDP